MRRVVLMVLVGALASVGAAASPAAAAARGEPCGGAFAAHFARWLDPLQYTLAAGGDLESTAGWRLSGGARLVDGNEPYYLNAAGDSHSLLLPPGSSAVSPFTCVGLTRPTLRFMAFNRGSALSALRVELLYRTRSGSVRALPALPPPVGLLHTSWAPTLPLLLSLGTVVDDVLTLDLSTTEVAFRFTPTTGLLTRGTWQIDDLYVDPWLEWW